MSQNIKILENRSLPWFHTYIIKVLQSGSIPKHIAIIMDGNRRFAERKNFERIKGHLLGFDKLTETLEWCMDLGVEEVTLYAFSIENFKRSKEEVDGLMELARQKFSILLKEKELIDKHGICIRIFGNMSYLPLDLQKIFAEGIHSTKNNRSAFLNICCSYTSREEMCHSMLELSEGLSQGLIEVNDIDESLFEKCLYSRNSPKPDIVIRTSGEVRLSDFLLWQSSYSVLAFLDVLWPEFTRWHFYASIIFYQRIIQKTWLNDFAAIDSTKCNKQSSIENQSVNKKLDNIITVSIKNISLGPHDDVESVEEINQKSTRIDTFLSYLDKKEDDNLLKLIGEPKKINKVLGDDDYNKDFEVFKKLKDSNV